MRQLVIGHDRIVCDFVSAAFPEIPNWNDRAIGIGVDIDGMLVAGCVIDVKSQFDAHLTVFSTTPRAFSPEIMRAVFTYLFRGLRVSRVSAQAAKKNKRSRKFIEGLGFRLEGVKRKGLDGIRDAIIYGMTEEDCRWLKEK